MSLPRMIIAGAGGVVGRTLVRAASSTHELVLLTRGSTRLDGARSVQWDPDAAANGDDAAIDALARELDGAAALVNLAGSSIAAGRLDDAHVRRVRESRERAGATLVAAALRADAPPPVWFQASGIDIYGDGGERVLDESTPVDGDGPIQVIGRAWEASADPAKAFARVIVGRIGVVLAPDAEAWTKLLLPIRLFVGGPLGSGRQWFPWIEADDLARAVLFLIEDPAAEGPYNLVAEPVRQIELTRLAARALRRPAFVPAPAFALRIALGRVADVLLLTSKRAVPARLREAGFAFEAPTARDAVAKLLG
jgi:uncharacterized protein